VFRVDLFNGEKMTNNTEKINIDKGLKCLVTIAAYYQIPCDPKSLVHQFAKEGSLFTDSDIIRAAKVLELKSRLVKIKIAKFPKMTAPAILKTSVGYALLLRADKERAMIAGLDESNNPKVLTIAQLREIWSGEIILFIPRKSDKRNVEFGFKWFMPTIVKYKSALGEVLIAALFMQILALFSPLITQSVIDKVLVHNSLSTLDILAIALILIAIFETVLSVARNYIFAHTASKIDVILSTRLFDHLFKLPMRYFETRRVGDTIARVRELENIRRFLTGVPMNTLLDALFIIVYIVVMLFYSTKLTLITIASIPILAIISAIVTPMLKERLDEKFKHGAEQQSYLVEAVTGIQTIKSFAVEPQAHKKWESLLSKYTTTTFRMTMLSGNSGAVAQFVQKVFDLAILWLGARLVIEGNLTVGALVAFRMLASRVSTPVLRLVQMWQDFQQTNISVQRLGDIFNTKPEPSMDSSKTRLPSIQGNICFDKVSFRYRSDTAEVIKNMSFEIRPDTVVGIVGKSGSGKSTISKLIQRMYIPESGKILIDGTDLSLAAPEWLRTQIGVVLQENFLFNMTVRENIALQNPAASMDDIIRVAKIAGAHEFILELPEGYDTQVGEKGTGLSGGQKQRVAIARALLTNPKILIFDEATSALDYESESIIQQNLTEICKGRTVLIIAHRLSTLKDADLIMVVDRGTIAEYDTPENLIKQQGIYYQLLRIQNGDKINV
jgi:subfamily B ATP-binding cassette protein HlyB/CyaB